jgi:hypothetical protein
MPKPSTLFGWTAAGTTPSTTLKTNGYVSGDRLPANHVDWWLELLTQWVDGYLDTLDNADNTWGGINAFTKQILIGEGWLSSLANALNTRIRVLAAPYATAPRTKVFNSSILNVVGGPGVNVYVAPASDQNSLDLELVYNAEWVSGGTWSRLKANHDAHIVKFFSQTESSAGGLYIASRQDNNATWSDAYDDSAGWTRKAIFAQGSGGSYTHQLFGTAQVSGATTLGGALTGTSATFSGAVAAGSGIYTSEHTATFSDYAGGSEAFGEWGPTTSISTRLPRTKAGSLVAFRVLVDAAAGQTLTVTVEKRAGGINGARTVLGTAVVVDPTTDQSGIPVGGNTYAAADVLIVAVNGNAITPRDISVVVQLQE